MKEIKKLKKYFMKIFELKNDDIAVYQRMLSIAVNDDTLVLNYAQEELAKICGVCPQTFRKIRHRLNKAGYISLEYYQNKYKRLSCRIKFNNVQEFYHDLDDLISKMKYLLIFKE